MKSKHTLGLSLMGLSFASTLTAATMSFSPVVNSQTDVDWVSGTTATKTVQKFFTGDGGEKLSLRIDFSAGGDSSGLRADGSYGARGWQPDGGSGAAAYRWINGETAYWTISILDRDNGDADVTTSYQVLLTSMEATNNGSVPDTATIVLSNGKSQQRSMQALAATGTQTHNFTGFDAKSMTFEMTNNPTHVQYFRVDTMGFEVTAIPEPSSSVLAGLGALALALRRKR